MMRVAGLNQSGAIEIQAERIGQKRDQLSFVRRVCLQADFSRSG
jgi:hypothetical protein